jgi:NADPH:quinone reductase-like Zn-dependent oxidoreductase
MSRLTRDAYTVCTNQEGTVKAIVQHKYGSPDALALQDVDKPEVNDDSVLVRVRAASVNAYDWHVMRGLPYIVRISEGLRGPKTSVAGVDVAGQVEAVGKDVTQFQPGDEVFGERAGALAEYVCGREHNFALKPTNLTFEEAAAVPMAGFTALQALRDKGHVQPGQRVLINGAAGGVGTFAVQIAKAFGANVTGVCSSGNVDLVRSIGADQVIDYTREDFTRSGQRYDLILDVAANRSLSDCRRVLDSNGILVVIGAPDGRWLAPIARVLTAVLISRFGSKKMLTLLAKFSNADLVVLKEMIEAGRITPVIDRTYALSEAPEAIRYLETKHAHAKVVISV